MNHYPNFRNRLLALLSTEDVRQLSPFLDRVDLPANQVLHRADEAVETLYFPESGLASLVVDLQDGATVEVGLVGNDGAVGVPAALTAGRSASRAFMQIGGEGLRLDAARIGDGSAYGGRLHTVLLQFTAVLYSQVAATAACNARHSLQERLARWLLMAHDRHDDDQLPLTHEFLSLMLGVRRSGVTIATGTLQTAGLIRCGRGRVAILDRRGLEEASCECYGAIVRQFDGTFGKAQHKNH